MNKKIETYGLDCNQNLIDSINFTISANTLSSSNNLILLNFCFYQTCKDSLLIEWDNRVFDLVMDYSNNPNNLYVECKDTLLIYNRNLVPSNVGVEEIFIIEKHAIYRKNQKGELQIDFSYINDINLERSKRYCFQQYLKKDIMPKNIPFRLVYKGNGVYLVSNWIEINNK